MIGVIELLAREWLEPLAWLEPSHNKYGLKMVARLGELK